VCCPQLRGRAPSSRGTPERYSTGPQRDSPRRRTQLPVRAPPCPRTLSLRAPPRSRDSFDARPPRVLPSAVAPAFGACPPRVLMHPEAPMWRQPPHRSSPKTPGGPNPCQVVSASHIRRGPRSLDHSTPIIWLAPVSRACWCRGEHTGACPKGARRDARPCPKGQGVTPDHAPRPPPEPQRGAFPWPLSPRPRAPQPQPHPRAAPPREALHLLMPSVPRRAPPHLRRSGSRGGRRSPHVRRSRRRAGRLRPALRGAP